MNTREDVDATRGLEIAKMLVLSTSHITQDSSAYLTDQSEMEDDPDLVVINRDYGFIIPIIKDFEEVYQEKRRNIPDDVTSLCEFCKNNKIEYLMLDRDGPIEIQFQQYEW